MKTPDPEVGHYDTQYGHFAEQLYAEVRAATFGEDVGQNGWLTAEEQDFFLSWLTLTRDSRLLDIACGSGGPALRIAGLTGCEVQGIDAHEQAIAQARNRSEAFGLSARARFERLDAAQRLPYADESFDCLTCIDAVNHLPNRPAIFEEWARLVKPGGEVLFTDPIVVTGALTSEEIAIRSSIGFFLFVPDGHDERLIEEAGFEIRHREDRTENMAGIAARWRLARQERAGELRRIEGEATFEGQQRFFAMTYQLASERRLSRIAIHAIRR